MKLPTGLLEQSGCGSYGLATWYPESRRRLLARRRSKPRSLPSTRLG